MADEFCLKNARLPRNIQGSFNAVNLRHGTDGFTSPPKEGLLRIFSPWKIPTASVGFEPANLVIKGKHATSIPPKPPKGEPLLFTSEKVLEPVPLRAECLLINWANFAFLRWNVFQCYFSYLFSRLFFFFGCIFALCFISLLFSGVLEFVFRNCSWKAANRLSEQQRLNGAWLKLINMGTSFFVYKLTY